MPHEVMSEQQVAAYLHMDLRDLVKLASRGNIPCRKLGDQRFEFRKSDVDHWVEQRIHELPRQDLADIEKGVSQHHGFDHAAALVSELIPEGGVRLPLAARTRHKVIRALVEHAEQLGLAYARDELIEQIEAREELCTTAMLPGAALPHPRHPLPWDIAESFVLVGIVPGGIPFGAEDGSLTRLFFLVCCKDDRTHLHVLARVARMLHDDQAIPELIDAEDAETALATIHRLELAAIEDHSE